MCTGNEVPGVERSEVLGGVKAGLLRMMKAATGICDSHCVLIGT